MELVTKWEEVLENLETLARYRRSRNSREVEFYSNLILKGICFVVHKGGDQQLWGPSRFVGYKKNSMVGHDENDLKDGRETTPVLTRIIGKAPDPMKVLEQRYKRHCQELGFEPKPRGAFGVVRKYWMK